jgi:hypothetical protein
MNAGDGMMEQSKLITTEWFDYEDSNRFSESCSMTCYEGGM